MPEQQPGTLNRSLIRELQDVMGADFGLLVETFVRDSRQRLQKLQDALAVGDADAFRRVAHSFKGSAANLGAVALSAQCQVLESLGQERRLDEVGTRLQRLAAEWAAVEQALHGL